MVAILDGHFADTDSKVLSTRSTVRQHLIEEGPASTVLNFDHSTKGPASYSVVFLLVFLLVLPVCFTLGVWHESRHMWLLFQILALVGLFDRIGRKSNCVVCASDELALVVEAKRISEYVICLAVEVAGSTNVAWGFTPIN